jgi:hypothetical protein
VKTLEKTLRKEVCKILRDAGLDPMAVENRCAIGVPDVECVAGWIELKTADGCDEDKVLRLAHDLGPEQRIWIRRRIKRGGSVWVLLQIGKVYLLLDGGAAAEHIGQATLRELRSLSIGVAESLTSLREELPGWIRNTKRQSTS